MKKLFNVVLALIFCAAIFSAPGKANAFPMGHMMFHHVHHMVATSGGSVSPLEFYLAIPLDLVVAACIWHIPAWNEAKVSDGNAIGSGGASERAYQRQEMWPQQLFDKLPGGTPGRLNP